MKKRSSPWLNNIRELGWTRLQEFATDRLQTNKIVYMAPIPKQAVRTFGKMNKPMEVKANDGSIICGN